MIIIAGIISIAADRRAACLAESAALQQATRDDEPGCSVVCSCHQCDDTAIVVYELWEDATLAAHFLHANYTEMRSLFGRHGITGAVTRKYRIDADAPEYNADTCARPVPTRLTMRIRQAARAVLVDPKNRSRAARAVRVPGRHTVGAARRRHRTRRDARGGDPP